MGSYNVHLPTFFRKLSIRQLRLLQEILYDGDGSHSKSRHDAYISCSQRLLNELQELFILCGKSASKRVHSVEENLRKYWKINKTKHIIDVYYSGKVYCTQTKNSIVCIRYKGKTMWIGNCYRSEGMVTEDSYNRLLKTAIDGGHESVLEHEKISILMTCSINTYKDITRHRAGVAFSIESTRWNNYSKGKFGNELTFINPRYINDEFKNRVWNNCMKAIEDYYMDMAKGGAKPDELRTMLPHSVASEVYMTANIREWRHILKLRTTKRVHPEIRQLLIPLLLKFKEDMPVLFDDIEYDTDFQKEWYADIEVRDLKELDNE